MARPAVLRSVRPSIYTRDRFALLQAPHRPPTHWSANSGFSRLNNVCGASATTKPCPTTRFPPPQELLAERLSTLYHLVHGDREVLVVNAQALLNRLPPIDFITSRAMLLEVGDRLDAQSLRERLTSQGYLRVEQVRDPGDLAIRGSLIDVYPTGAEYPVRIDLFDDEIENLRIFDPHTQLSTDRVRDVRILPAREFPFDVEDIRSFRQRFRDHVPGEPGRALIYREISDAQLPAGIEYYLPLFFDETASLADYLPKETLIVLMEEALGGPGVGLVPYRGTRRATSRRPRTAHPRTAARLLGAAGNPQAP